MTHKILRNVPETGLVNLLSICNNVFENVSRHNRIIDEFLNNDEKINIMYTTYVNYLQDKTYDDYDVVKCTVWGIIPWSKRVDIKVKCEPVSLANFKKLIDIFICNGHCDGYCGFCISRESQHVDAVLRKYFITDKTTRYTKIDLGFVSKYIALLTYCDEIDVNDTELEAIRSIYKNRTTLRCENIDIKMPLDMPGKAV